MRFLLCLFLLLVVSQSGCASTAMDASHRAPMCDDTARLERVASRLKVVPAIRCQIIDSKAPGAFAWRDRRVGVTRGLLRIATDDELAAAIAHEVGHLVQDGHLTVPASLRGDNHTPGTDVEASADAMGVRILRDSAIDPGAMSSLLGKLKAHVPSSRVDRALDQRIELLRGN